MRSLKINNNQSGFASMVIALVLVLLMSMLTVAYTQLSRREQKSSLDKQLATQAYFAAETGINDVIDKITSKITDADVKSKLATVNANKCLTPTQLNDFGLTRTIDTSRGLSYSCVMVDATPSSLDFSNVTTGAEKYLTFSATNELGSFDITWTNIAKDKNALRTSGGFAPNGSWGSPAVIQVYLTPIISGDMDTLADNTFVTFLYPAASSLAGSPRGTINFTTAPDSQGQITLANCSLVPDDPVKGVATCTAKIAGLSGNQPYLIRVVDYYSDSDITIGNAKATDGTTDVKFVDAQAKIDVTGRARDVLKRIKVSSPLNQGNIKVKDAIEAQNLCKRITTEPAITNDDTAIPQCTIWAPSTP